MQLLGRGVEDGVVEVVIAELSEQGTLDDARFARLFAEDKRTLEQWGNERIRRALDARGIERELAEAALADEPEYDERGGALALLRQRFPSPPRERQARERALGVLIRKGYDYELAVDALSEHCRVT